MWQIYVDWFTSSRYATLPIFFPRFWNEGSTWVDTPPPPTHTHTHTEYWRDVFGLFVPPIFFFFFYFPYFCSSFEANHREKALGHVVFRSFLFSLQRPFMCRFPKSSICLPHVVNGISVPQISLFVCLDLNFIEIHALFLYHKCILNYSKLSGH